MNGTRTDRESKPKGTGKRVGELLIEAGLIDEQQLSEALSLQRAQGGKTVEILISLGHVTAQSFMRFLGHQGLGSIDLERYEIDPELLRLVPRDFALTHELIPVDWMKGLLTVAMVCPLDVKTIGELENLTGLRVKALLCSAEDVRSSIERYYTEPETGGGAEASSPEGLAAPLKLRSVACLIRQMDSFPRLPGTIHKLREAIQDPESCAEDIAQVISTDPSVAAKLLSVANSSAYGLPRRVDSLRLAVSLMGPKETYLTALSIAVVDLREKSKTFNYKQFWMDSLMCASVAGIVAKALGHEGMPGLFAAGLLRDIGRLALADFAPDGYGEIGKGLEEDNLVAAEEEAFGVAHPEVGYLLAEHWSFPADIMETIRFHHCPDQANDARDMAIIVALAGRLIRPAREGGEKNRDLFSAWVNILTGLELDEEVVTDLHEQVATLQNTQFLWNRKWSTLRSGDQEV